MHNIYLELKLHNSIQYPIYFGTDLFNKKFLQLENSFLLSLLTNKQIIIITNTVVAPWYLEKISTLVQNYFSQLQPLSIIIPDGEKYKNFTTYNEIINQLLEHKITRNSVIIALGGGVISDLAGYIAATYLRGIDLINIPTTLLAQVDATLGGKVGINHELGKNLLGTFYHPKAIFIDTDFLATQSDKDFFAGMAEVIKYGLAIDKTLFEFVEKWIDKIKIRDNEIIQEIIKRSIVIKSQIIKEDQYDKINLRAKLNFGHTVGHALEKASNYQLLHGEAVALGMLVEVRLSALKNGLDRSVETRLIEVLQKLNLPTEISCFKYNDLINALVLDKKNTGNNTINSQNTLNSVNFILLTKLGKAQLQDCSLAEIKNVLQSKLLSDALQG